MSANLCQSCSTSHDGSFGSGRFCSRVCANKRIVTEDHKKRVSATLKGRPNPRKIEYVKICGTCSTQFVVTGTKKYVRFCSTKCRTPGRIKSGQALGKANALTVNKRSKNEILFASFCQQHWTVLENTPMFNGWDADIILPDHKVAVLWNGPWHYKKITKKHSVEQVQNRDKIKLKEIEKAGFIGYVIRDNGSFNQRIVEQEFQRFKTWIGELAIMRLS